MLIPLQVRSLVGEVPNLGQLNGLTLSSGYFAEGVAAYAGGRLVARGELVAVVNSDDPLRPGYLEAMVRALVDRPEALVAYPDWEIIDESSRVIECRRAPEHDFRLMVTANWLV